MNIQVTPNKAGSFDITGPSLSRAFLGAKEIIPDSGQIVTTAGYRDADKQTIAAARAAGVPTAAAI